MKKNLHDAGTNSDTHIDRQQTNFQKQIISSFYFDHKNPDITGVTAQTSAG